jgi:hypothetical protein
MGRYLGGADACAKLAESDKLLVMAKMLGEEGLMQELASGVRMLMDPAWTMPWRWPGGRSGSRHRCGGGGGGGRRIDWTILAAAWGILDGSRREVKRNGGRRRQRRRSRNGDRVGEETSWEENGPDYFWPNTKFWANNKA